MTNILRFEDPPTLWHDASRILAPPLSSVLTLEELPKDLPVYVSGTTALARLTLLAEEDLPVFAVSRRLFYRGGRQPDSVPVEKATCRLELWDRVYLNLRHGDERVRLALAELLREHGLGEPS